MLLGFGDNKSLKYFYDIYICVYVSIHLPGYIVGPEDNLQVLVLSFRHVGSED